MGKIMRNGVQYGVDTADVLTTVADCTASTNDGQVAGAKALSELNSNLYGGNGMSVAEMTEEIYNKLHTIFNKSVSLKYDYLAGAGTKTSTYTVEDLDPVFIMFGAYGNEGGSLRSVTVTHGTATILAQRSRNGIGTTAVCVVSPEYIGDTITVTAAIAGAYNYSVIEYLKII